MGFKEDIQTHIRREVLPVLELGLLVEQDLGPRAG